MLETELRDLFDRQASGDQPPSQISITAVSRTARSRLRLRRAGAVATPLLAAGAVAAIVALTAVPAAHPGTKSHPAAHPTPAPAPAAPAYFDPLRPYASFGWLPAGMTILSDTAGTTIQYLYAARPGQGSWMLAVYAAGRCSFAHMQLRCAGLSSKFDPRLTSQAPDVDGRPAYWTYDQTGDGILVFQYARDGWAKFSFRERAYALRIAEHVTFGAATAQLAPIRFPAQLAGMPGGWQLRYATSNPSPGGYLAGIFGFASGAALHAPGPGVPYNYPVVDVTKANPNVPCYVTAGESTQGVVAGYPVTVTRVPAGSGGAAVQELCAANAAGLSVDIFVQGNHPAADVTTVFAHLRLLGPDPAHWTTQPIG
jgi:hypothetical protein